MRASITRSEALKKHPEKILWMFFMTIAPHTFSTSLQPYIAVYKKNGHSIYYDFSDYDSCKKHPSQYVSNKSFTSVMSCFLFTFAPLYSVISL